MSVSPFLAWGDFHARSRFALSTIPEGKLGLLVVYGQNANKNNFYSTAPLLTELSCSRNTTGQLATFLESPGNLSDTKANFRIKTCLLASQFLAHKPVNFASLIVISLFHFQNN